MAGGEKVRLKAPGVGRKHTLLCVFTCLLDELSYSGHAHGGRKGGLFCIVIINTLKYGSADFFLIQSRLI